jgi:aspartyl-tRNA(Asn)/glutamyl-tRNA(Gln) amidotransferase subunit B
MITDFEAVIGLEVHCQLATETKIFCGCPSRSKEGDSVADLDSNSNTCPVCTGHPGTLPVLNKKVLEYAVKAGLATNCTIQTTNIFARKNYFYPDLPKGYQISQYEKPICEHGWLEIETRAGTRKIPIQRIHMEEDAGKNTHMSGYSLVNLNRAGVPLVEIVTGPDMKTSEEAGAYLRALHALVSYLGISDANMQEGNFRCDANVSVMPRGSKTFGTRVEIKNVNSFKFVEKAIDYEIARQIEVIKAGGKITQETRGYDSSKNVTTVMRTKEEAMDYRYFPDPDLIPIQIAEAWIKELKKSLPELPNEKKRRFVEVFHLTPYDAGVLTSSKVLAGFFERTLEMLSPAGAKPVANWITGELSRLANENEIDLDQSPFTPQHLADLIKLTQAQALSSTGAKQVLQTIWKEGGTVDSVVTRDGLKQVSDTSALEPKIDEVLAAHPTQVAEFKAGKEKVLGFIVGQVMKATGGKANPSLLQELIRQKLK